MPQSNLLPPEPPPASASCCTPGKKKIGLPLAIAILFALGVLAFVVYSQLTQPGKNSASSPSTANPATNASSGNPSDSPSPTDMQPLQERFQKAVESRNDAQVQKVLEDCQALIKRYPNHAPLHTFVAQIYLAGDHFTPAYEALQKSLALDKQQPEVHLLAGTIALQLHQVQQAAQHYSQAVGLAPREPRYKIHLAQVYFTLNDLNRAKETYLQALHDDSSLHAAYKGLADIYTRENKLEIALTQIQKAIQNTPISQRPLKVIYLRQQAQLLRRANRPEESLQILQSLSPKERLDASVVEETAVTWAMLDQPTQAAQEYDSALEIQPMDAALLAGAAQWWLKAGDKQKALDRLENLRRVAPHSPQVLTLQEAIQKQK